MARTSKDRLVEFYEKHPFPNDPGSIPHFMKYSFGRLHGKEDPRTVLVVGCGTGEDAEAARRYFPKATVVGIDPSGASIRLARRHYPHIRFLRRRIESYDPGRRFDLVFCSGVLHHTERPLKNLQKIMNLLTTDGTLFLGIYHHGRWDVRVDYRRSEAHILDGTENPRERTYSWEGLTELVGAAGGHIVRTGHRLPVPRWRWLMLLYDLAFLQARQQIMMVTVKRLRH